ncbi:MAG: hypothetical protein AB1553_00570 [Nitrospirota bacterium]
MIQAGDKILVKPLRNIISEIISGKVNSLYSHVEPIVDSRGGALDCTFPRNRIKSISQYFHGKHRVLIIRPAKPYTAEELLAWTAKALEKDGTFYDLFRLCSALNNKRWKMRRNMWACDTATMDCDKAIGRHTWAEFPFVSYEMYHILAREGIYKIVYQAERPTMGDFQKLVRG